MPTILPRYNENSYRNYPFLEDLPLTLVNGGSTVVMPKSAVIDLRATLYAGLREIEEPPPQPPGEGSGSSTDGGGTVIPPEDTACSASDFGLSCDKFSFERTIWVYYHLQDKWVNYVNIPAFGSDTCCTGAWPQITYTYSSSSTSGTTSSKVIYNPGSTRFYANETNYMFTLYSHRQRDYLSWFYVSGPCKCRSFTTPAAQPKPDMSVVPTAEDGITMSQQYTTPYVAYPVHTADISGLPESAPVEQLEVIDNYWDTFQLNKVTATRAATDAASTLTLHFVSPIGSEITFELTMNAALPYKQHKFSTNQYTAHLVFGAGVRELYDSCKPAAAGTKEWVPPDDHPIYVEAACISSQSRHRLDIIAPNNGEELSGGPVLFKAGYNCDLRLTEANNTITIGAERGAGEGLYCGDLSATTVPFLRRFNDATADLNGNLTIRGGNGITVTSDPDNHKIVINSKIRNYVGCNE